MSVIGGWQIKISGYQLGRGRKSSAGTKKIHPLSRQQQSIELMICVQMDKAFISLDRTVSTSTIQHISHWLSLRALSSILKPVSSVSMCWAIPLLALSIYWCISVVDGRFSELKSWLDCPNLQFLMWWICQTSFSLSFPLLITLLAWQ